ncbi:MAG TPA: helix-turn-helix transcriptional regulator [Microbacteriaceae bacterium]|nr:helix-turn-helix transcriptional regulator [Microbacteriaceae bacterium]
MRTAPIRTGRAFADALREFRVASGMTQRELADATGVTQSLIAELESGKTTKAIERCFLLLRALDAHVVIMDSRNG